MINLNYSLPTKLEIDGKEFDIRSDFRAILDILSAFEDVNLTTEEKTIVMLKILYPKYDEIEDMQTAIEKACWFIDGGTEYENKDNQKPVMSWEQDFKLIIAPINKVLGYECRAKEYVHWWTFLSAYNEIGESTYSTVTSIRSKRNKGKKLEKWEKDFLREHREIVVLQNRYTDEEKELMKEILG